MEMGTNEADPGLQLAPAEGDLPDFGKLKESLSDAVRSVSDFKGQCQTNFEVRHAIWDGQTTDGKKHYRVTGQTEVTPWDGASDIRCYVVDEAINAYVAMIMQAWRKSTLVAVPIQGADAPRAKVISQFLRYLCASCIPNLDREVEIAANRYFEQGIAAMGVFWEVRQDRVLKTVRVSDMPPELQAQLPNPELASDFVAMAQQSFGITEKRAKKLIADLINDGEAQLPVAGPRISRPVVRTFDLAENLFIHSSVTDPENAAAIWRIEYYTASQLRDFVASDGWDAEWVECAIESARDKQVASATQQSVSDQTRRTLQSADKYKDLIGVVYAYRRLSDDEGVTGVYCSIFNPEMPPCDEHTGFAKHGLLEYGRGQYPFVILRRENLDRRLYSTRGLPEIGESYQKQIKACSDARIDAASLSVIPTLFYPQGRPPPKIGPGAKVPERRAGEYHFGDKPSYDPSNTVVEEKLLNNWREYVGHATAEGDPQAAQVKKAEAVARYLSDLAMVLQKVFALWQEMGDDKTWFRVVGSGNTDPQLVEKGSPDERFDFYITYNSLMSADPESFEKIVTSLAQMIASFDRYGQVAYDELLTMVVSAIDPSIADRIILPKQQAAQKTVTEVKDLVTRVAAGFDEDIQLGTPPQIGMQVIQQYASNPEVQQRLSQDKGFAERLEKLMKQFNMQQMQEENKQIGRLGA